MLQRNFKTILNFIFDMVQQSDIVLQNIKKL